MPSVRHTGRQMPRFLRLWLGAVILAMAAPLAQTACASSLQVSPILLEFAPQSQAQALWLRNTGDAPLRAQVRVMRWIQAEGTETLEATRELIASPAVLEVAAGERQLVRIVLLQQPQDPQERAYRLIVDELPGDTQQESSGLQFLLRYSIPVFVGGPARPAPANATSPSPPVPVALSATWQDGQLSVTNIGPRRVRLSQLTWVNPDGSRAPVVPGLLGYALAGQRMQWPLELPKAAKAGGTLHARFDNDPQEQPLPLLTPVR